MDERDKQKIAQIIADRKCAHKFYYENSNAYRKFVEMEKATYSDGDLKKKYKELIAVGISIVLNCESCLEWHINEAIKAGAEKNQIVEAIDVGMEMGGGPATVAARFAMKVLEYYL